MRQTNQIEILKAVRRRIIEECPPLTEGCVVISDDELPEGSRDSTVATLWVTDGQYDDGLHEGGGIHQTVEHAGVAITLWRRNWSDRAGHGIDLMTEDNLGLLELKRKILVAFSGHDLADEDGNPLLVNYMAPLNSDSPRRMNHFQRGTPVGDIRLTFSTDFLWDLGDGEEDEE